MKNGLTVDLEDWYHVCGVPALADPAGWDAFESRVAANTDRVLALLRRHGARATFFVLGRIAEREPALVRAVAAEGHEVATHGHFHRRIYEMTPEAFEEDLLRSIDAIRGATGSAVEGHRAPEWSMRPHTLWALEILRRHGIRYDSSMVPLTRMGSPGFPSRPGPIATPAGEIFEFPLTTMRCFGERVPFTGGLALRVTPYFYILSKILRMNREGEAALAYFHPWELDPAPPRLPLPATRRFMTGFNLPGAAAKLSGMMRHLAFAPLRELLPGGAA
jgi:polysaccharide deacetylase family protein (PEP-CTERM system associated)